MPSSLIDKKISTYPAQAVTALKKLENTFYWQRRNVIWMLKKPSNGASPAMFARVAVPSGLTGKPNILSNMRFTLVESFRELYRDEFVFEGNRAMVFQLGQNVNWQAFRHCVSMSLQYHKIKHLPLLGT